MFCCALSFSLESNYRLLFFSIAAASINDHGQRCETKLPPDIQQHSFYFHGFELLIILKRMAVFLN